MRIDVYPKNNERYIHVALEVEFRTDKETAYPHWDVDLKDCPTVTELSIVGTVWEGGRESHGGQCVDYIRSLFQYDSETATDMRRLCDLWDRWHLNGMRPGCRAQRDALAGFEPDYDWYGEACVLLQCKQLYEVEENGRKYTFGTAWLAEPLPAEVVKEINDILERIGE
jgi:hypothetical protein